ncbi:MAG TPA: ankyrin repeat domain-containing protein [Candidatus Saccharimonadales bacterium]|nr:ankyrin repeat domain-containing protein [Candidatus Saccharimonadales bacterium]
MKKQLCNILFFSIIIYSNITLSSSPTDKPIQSDFALTIKFFDAIAYGNIQDVQQLLAQGIQKDVITNSTDRDTALIVAIRYQENEIVRFLIEQGFDKNAKNSIGQSPLLIAAQNDDIGGILDLCCVGAQELDIQVTDDLYNTPLHIIADKDNYMGVFFLIKYGKVDPKQKNFLGCTPLHTACARGALNAVKCLLTYGHKDQLNAIDNAGRTPLYWALSNDNDDVVETLMQESVLTSKRTLKRFVCEGNVKVVKKLFAMGAWKDKDELLGLAISHGHASVLRVLIDAGVDKDVRTQEGATVLHYAAFKGYVEVLNVLLDAGIDKDARTQEGATVLHYAARNGSVNTLKVLLNAGVDKNRADNFGLTPRDCAQKCGNFQAVKLLEEYQPAAIACSISENKK